MLDVQVQLPPSTRLALRDFTGGFTDWKCGCPENFFTIFCNFDILDNRSICERFGSRPYDLNNPRVPNEKRVQHMDCLKGNILYFSGRNISALVDGTLTNISGAQTDQIMFGATDDTCSDSAFWQDHIYTVDDTCSQPTKIYCNRDGDLVARTAGIPPLLVPPTVTSNTNEGASYLYAFVRCCEYDVQDSTFIDFSDSVVVQITDGPDFDTLGESVDITGITPLVSPPGINYDEANVDVKVYRTTNGGTTFYEIGVIPNGQTTFTDGQPDTSIINNPIIFNQDSAITYDPAPPSKYIEIINDVAWYAHTKIDGVIQKNRLYQSLPSDPDTVPRDFFIEFKGEINGLSNYDIYPIVSTITREGECTLWRVEGVLDEQGRNILQARVIIETVASINNNSFVKGKNGLYFFGTDGVYRTDGIRAQKLSEKWDDTYCRITETDRQKKNVYGTYDKFRDKVYWGVTNTPGFENNNEVLVFKERTNTFSWWKNDNCLGSTSLIVKEKDGLIRADEFGHVMSHHEFYYGDALPDPDEPDTSQWLIKHIPWRIRSVEIDGGDCHTDKWYTKIQLQGKPTTNVTLGINSYDNGCKTPKNLKDVQFKYSDGWCAEDVPWCSEPWCEGSDCYMYETRRFACGKLRSKTKCIELFRQQEVLECSIPGDNATFASVNADPDGIAKISQANFIKYGQDALGMVLTIEDNEYVVTSQDGGTFCVDDPDNVLSSGVQEYQLTGYELNQRFCLSCISMTYCVLSNEDGGYMAPEAKGGD